MRGNTFLEFAENQASFITFNYDRSLEYFVGRALADSYNKTDVEVATVMKNIPIIHVHGRLGYLPWQQQENARPYAPGATAEVLDMCAQEIKVMHEGTDANTPEFEDAKRLLMEAKRIYFMGVGFNSLNLHQLGVDTLSADKAASTCVGYAAREFGQLSEQYRDKLCLHHAVGCMELLRNHVKWS